MNLGSIIGGVVGYVVGGPVGAAAGAAIGGTQAAQDAADAAAEAAGWFVIEEGRVYVRLIEGVGKVYLSLGSLVINAVEDVGELFLYLTKGIIGMRPLRPSEKAIATRVFGRSIPLDRIVISSLDGIGSRPFTVPCIMLQSYSWVIPGIGPLMAITAMIRGLTDKYILFLGEDGYNDAINYRVAKKTNGTYAVGPGQKLVHELTHVWQGHNGGFAWGYVINSVLNQIAYGSHAYDYLAGGQWNSYDVEPQAHIVEDWYNATLNKALNSSVSVLRSSTLIDPVSFLGAYIDCNIRPGQPNAHTVFPTAYHNHGSIARAVLNHTVTANTGVIRPTTVASAVLKHTVSANTGVISPDTPVVRVNPSLKARHFL
jgi:hypothetical protein